MTRNENSPAPGVEQTGNKAIFSAVAAGVVAFVAYWVSDSKDFEPKEIGAALLLAISASGVGGLGTYKIPNKLKPQRRR